MRKLLLFLCMVLITGQAFAAAPTRANSYVSGTVIDPTAVTGNEVPLYTYLQAGVDTYAAGSITNSAINATAGITYSKLNLGGGILPGDVNTSATTNIYTFGSVAIPNTLTLNTTIPGGVLFDNGTNISKLAPGSIGQLLITKGAGANPIWGWSPYVKASNTQSSGVNAGATTSGSWQTTILNTLDNDTASIASLATNQVTLPAGTYFVHAVSTFNNSSSVQTRIYNITDSAILVNGQDGSSLNGTLNFPVEGIFTISGTKAVALQYQSASSIATTGQGGASSFGTEVYAVVEFVKIS